MTLTLPAQYEGFVRDKVKAGTYASEEEVVGAALGLLQKQDGDYERQLEWLRDAIDVGWDQARAGKLTSAEDFEVELEEYQRQWLAARGQTR